MPFTRGNARGYEDKEAGGPDSEISEHIPEVAVPVTLEKFIGIVLPFSV